MYAAQCDKCGCGWESIHGYSAMHTKNSVQEYMSDQDWIVGDYLDDKTHAGKVYCPLCAEVNDKDEIVFTETLQANISLQ